MIAMLAHGSAVGVGRVMQRYGRKTLFKCMTCEKQNVQTCNFGTEWPTFP